MNRTAGRRAHSTLQRLARAAGALRRDRRGSVAVFMALALVPMVAGVGIGVDTARGYLVRARLHQGLDAAALAGGRVANESARNADIKMYFDANFPQGFMGATVTGPTITADRTGEVITVTASATLPATFMQVLGHKTITVSATSTVTRANTGMELALVMDNTGSMNSSGKMGAMKSAAQNLVNTLFGGNEDQPNLYVGIVPFVAMVNIGSDRSGWTHTPTYTQFTVTSLARTTNSGVSRPATSTMCATTSAAHGFKDGMLIDVSGADQSAYNGRFQIRVGAANSTAGCTITAGTEATKFWYIVPTGSGTTPATGAVKAYRPAVSYPAAAPWKGCVEMRADPYETTSADASPSTASFPKAFAPSTNGVRFYETRTGGSYYKQLMKNSSSSTNYYTGDNDWTTSSIDESRTAGNDAKTPNKGCADPITPLQPQKSAINAAIGNMQPWWGGGTAVPTGLAWGWRMLSPHYRGLWGAPTPANLPLDYGTSNMHKVVVLLTDGVNEVVAHRMPGCDGGTVDTGYRTYRCPPDSDYTAYGRLSERRFGDGVDTDPEITAELNSRITSLCTAMKAKGIIIYTILLQVNDPTTDNLYRNCATKPEYYFNSPTAAQLHGIFTEIGKQLSKLRVSQ